MHIILPRDAEAAKRAAEGGKAPSWVWIPGGYATVRDLMGDEEAWVALRSWT